MIYDFKRGNLETPDGLRYHIDFCFSALDKFEATKGRHSEEYKLAKSVLGFIVQRMRIAQKVEQGNFRHNYKTFII